MFSLKTLRTKLSPISKAGERSEQSQTPTIVTTFFSDYHSSLPQVAWETDVHYHRNDERNTDAKADFLRRAESAVAKTMTQLEERKLFDTHEVCPRSLLSVIGHYTTTMAGELPITEVTIKAVCRGKATAHHVECMCPEHIINGITLRNLTAITQRYGQEGSKCVTQLYLCTHESDQPIESTSKLTFNASQAATLRSYLDTINSIVQPVVTKHVTKHQFFQTHHTDNECDNDIREARDKAIMAARDNGLEHPYGDLWHWTRHRGAASDTAFDRECFGYARIHLENDPVPETVNEPSPAEEPTRSIVSCLQGVQEE